ncbi:MAG: hypothetical protein IPL76_21245 [Gemmatimonadetes bacterium]|nr:hypothetical protein [Gemmatimonadota bacterium]
MARVTTYAPDRYERDSLMTDALGSWRTRYEAVRGLVDALMTPLGDTLLLSFDHQGRLVADSIRSAGLRVTNALSYTSDGTPKRWSTAMQVPSTWGAGADDQGAQNDALPALQPVWNQIRGLGGAADTLRAELLYDARERLSTWDGIGSLSGGVTESYTIDRAGNLGTVGGGEVFHGTTNRMLRRANGASRAWNYSYDAAGNLIQAVDSGTVSVTYTYAYDALNRLVRVAQGRHADRAVRLRRARAAHRQAGLLRRHRRHGGLHPVRVSRRAGGLRDRLGRQHDRHPVCLGSGDGQPGGVPDHRGRDRPLLCGDRQAGQRPPDHQAGRHWVRTYGYTPYGSVAANAGSGVTLRYRWTGREWDAETGWYFHRARYYDPGQRRFVQEDPAGAAGGENLYAYVGGQALVLRDPSGQWAEGGPPQPFQDPCPGFDTCYEHGIEIDGVFVKGWDLGMVARFNFKTNSERAGNGCPAWLNEASVEGAINDVWDASMSSQPDDLGRVPEFGVALSGSAGGLVAGGLIEGSHDPNDAFGVSASLTAGQHFALVHSHPNAGKPWPELGSGMTFGDKLSGTFGDIGRGGDWAIATQGFWVVAVGKSSNSRRLGLRVGSPEGKSSMCSVAKRVSAP